jgi:hypothetical protein
LRLSLVSRTAALRAAQFILTVADESYKLDKKFLSATGIDFESIPYTHSRRVEPFAGSGPREPSGS